MGGALGGALPILRLNIFLLRVLPVIECGSNIILIVIIWDSSGVGVNGQLIV
jgi:hypothetical protein